MAIQNFGFLFITYLSYSLTSLVRSIWRRKDAAFEVRVTRRETRLETRLENKRETQSMHLEERSSNAIWLGSKVKRIQIFPGNRSLPYQRGKRDIR